MKTKLRKGRLYKLAAFLDSLSKRSFKFSRVVDRSNEDRDGNICGTVCCAVGWLPKLFPSHWEWISNTVEITADLRKNTDSPDWVDSASKFFGITYLQSMCLFSPGCKRDWAPGMLAYNATPKQVADSIRQFVKWKERKKAKRIKK